MIVPSRSRKTAGAFSLAADVILETGDQFFARHGGRTELADDDGAGVVGNLGGFERRRVAGERERKQGDGGVARAGNVEDLARFGRECDAAVRPSEKASCPCSPSVMRRYFVSHFFSNASPARLRSTSFAGDSSGSRHGIPAARNASARFGFTAVMPLQSIECRGFGSAVTIFPAARASRAIWQTSSVVRKPLP